MDSMAYLLGLLLFPSMLLDGREKHRVSSGASVVLASAAEHGNAASGTRALLGALAWGASRPASPSPALRRRASRRRASRSQASRSQASRSSSSLSKPSLRKPSPAKSTLTESSPTKSSPTKSSLTKSSLGKSSGLSGALDRTEQDSVLQGLR